MRESNGVNLGGALSHMNTIRSRGNALESISSEEVQVNLHPNIKLLVSQTPKTQHSLYRNHVGSKATKVMPVDDQLSDLDTKRSFIPMCSKSREIIYDRDDLDNS